MLLAILGHPSLPPTGHLPAHLRIGDTRLSLFITKLVSSYFIMLPQRCCCARKGIPLTITLSNLSHPVYNQAVDSFNNTPRPDPLYPSVEIKVGLVCCRGKENNNQ